MRIFGGLPGRRWLALLLLGGAMPGLAGCHGVGGRCSSCGPLRGAPCGWEGSAPCGEQACGNGQCQTGGEYQGACYEQTGCEQGCGPNGGCDGCAMGFGPNCYIGCIDTIRVRMNARANARRVLRATYGPRPRISCHYADGFEQAFVDLAEGGDGTLPPVPPQRYWNAEYRCPGGSGCAREWFVGYEAGAAAADATVPCPHPVIPLSGTAWLAVPVRNDYGLRHQNQPGGQNCQPRGETN